MLKETAKWFEDLWSKSDPVDAPALKRAREAWRRKQPAADPKATALETFVRDPDWFRERVWVTRYVTEADPKAKAKFEKIKRKYYSPNQLDAFKEGNLPLYQWSLKGASATTIGDSLIDLVDGKIYELLETVPYSTAHCIALLKPVKKVQGLRFPTQERRLLKKAVGEYLANSNKNFECNLEELPDSVRQSIIRSMWKNPEESVEPG